MSVCGIWLASSRTGGSRTVTASARTAMAKMTAVAEASGAGARNRRSQHVSG